MGASTPPTPPAADSSLPGFFILGHAKSGTTALYEMLRRHPQIFMPERKEPWFFADELHERTPPRPGGTPRTLAEYRQWFADAPPGSLIGEATALYLFSRSAPERIAAACPEAKLIAIFREPSSFLRSLHMQFVRTNVERESDFRRALALEEARRAGQEHNQGHWPRALLYSDHVRYAEQLRRYHEHFPPERLLVLIYDDLRADNLATVRRVLRFLEVDAEAPIGAIEANASLRVRSHALHSALQAVSVGHGPASRTLKAAVKALTPRSLRRRSLDAIERRLVFARPEPADELLAGELKRRFAAEVDALSEYIKRDLAELWGYV